MKHSFVRSAAKVNLTLDIVGQLPNGYHELSSIVHTIGIWDDLQIQWQEAAFGVKFSCSRPDLGGDDNLVVKAVRAFEKATDIAVGASVYLIKNIPSGAGLGGGSGNAAAMLTALNTCWGHPLTADELTRVGSTLGADVPLFLRGGALLMEGIGERLTSLTPLRGHLLVVKPQISLSTPDIYRAWDTGGFKSNHATRHLLELWPPSTLDIASGLSNDLEKAAERTGFVAEQYLAQLRAAGALGARMTGSGSACFGIFASEDAALEGHSDLAAQLGKQPEPGNPQLFVAPLCEMGVEVISTV